MRTSNIFDRFHSPRPNFSDYNLIGFDFGDGMLSACSVHWNAVEKRLVITPLYFDRAHARQQIVAAAYLGDKPSDTDILVFEGGLVKDGSGVSYYNYKRCPCTEDAAEPFKFDAPIPRPTPEDPHRLAEYSALSYEQIMPRVFKLAIHTLFECNLGVLDRSKPTIILVGRPSSAHWTQSEKAYAKLLNKSLSIHACGQKVHVRQPSSAHWTKKKSYSKLFRKNRSHVLIQSESTAALARHTDPNWHDAISRDEYVIVIDCGSSTFDVTLITPMGIPEDGEDSRQFGGNLLDANFLKLLQSSVPDGWTFEVPHGTKLTLRVKKEAYYGPRGTSCEDQILKVPVVSASHERKNHRFEIDDDSVRKAVQEMPVTYFEYVESITGLSLPKRVDCDSWLAGVHKIFREFHDKLVPVLPHGHAKFDRVILSGGVSIMPEVQQAVTDTFGVQPAVSESLNFSVAEGLAYVLGVEARKQALITQLKEKLSDYFPTNWDSTSSLRSAIADAGAAEDWEAVRDSLKAWANAEGNLTQDDWRQKFFAPLFQQRVAQNLGNNVIDGTRTWYEKQKVGENIHHLLHNTFDELFPGYKNQFAYKIDPNVYLNALAGVTVNVHTPDRTIFGLWHGHWKPHNLLDRPTRQNLYNSALKNQHDIIHGLSTMFNNHPGLRTGYMEKISSERAQKIINDLMILHYDAIENFVETITPYFVMTAHH